MGECCSMATPTEEFEKREKEREALLSQSITINGIPVTYKELFGTDDWKATDFASKVALLMKGGKGVAPTQTNTNMEEEIDV